MRPETHKKDAMLASDKDNKRLLDAATIGDIATLERIINTKDLLRYYPDGARGDALNGASENGHVDAVEAILPFCKKSRHSFKAAGLAAMNGHSDCLKLLLPDDPSTILDTHVFTHVLNGAAKKGYLECVNLLLSAAKCSVKTKMYALEGAIEHCQRATINRLLEDDQVKKACGTTGGPASTVASSSDLNTFLAVLSILKTRSVSLNEAIMLDMASYNKDPGCLKFLLQTTKRQPTMEHVSRAVTADSYKCVKVLAPLVNLDDESWCNLPKVTQHPLVRACAKGKPKSIAALVPHTKDTRIINVALLNGIYTIVHDTGISREDLIVLYRKADIENLHSQMEKAAEPDKDYVIGLSVMFEKEQTDTMRAMKKELEILGRVDTLRMRASAQHPINRAAPFRSGSARL